MRPATAATLLLVALGSGRALGQSTPLATPLGESGRFGRGIGIELLGAGPCEAFTRFGAAGGMSLASAVQIDLGPRWAMRFPLSLDLAFRNGGVGYGSIAITPGLVYRWRSSAAQRWIPYLGGGARLASSGVHRDFVGLPQVVTSALHIDEHHHFSGGGGSSDPNIDAEGTISPEVWAGFELHSDRWLAVIFGAAYAWIWIDSESVHLLRETVAVRATF
jgi:hypothetical protein